MARRRNKKRELRVGARFLIASLAEPPPEPPLLLTFRERRGFTQRQAARWYGVTERSWRRWENGEVRTPRPVVRRVRASM